MNVEILAFEVYSEAFYSAARIYATVWGHDEEESLMLFRRYARLSHFYGYVARINQHIVGMAFGTASQEGQWWHDKVAEKIGRKHSALRDAWVLTEIAVLPDFQNQGLGAILHDRVTTAQPLPNLLLSTQVANLQARHFYEKRAWVYLHSGFTFQYGGEAYVIMARKKNYDN